MQLYICLFYAVAGGLFYWLTLMAATQGRIDFSLRFPAIEAFLPLSSLVGLKQLLSTGIFDQVHPAGLAILLTVITSAALLGRGFCSHICPVGTISDMLDHGRGKLLGFKITPPRLLHYLLLAPKYLLLVFFIKAIMLDMTGTDAAAFIKSPYNVVTDVKMLNFFLEPSALTLDILALLAAMSVIIPFFWCRYLCPYGALLNVFAVFAPVRIRREEALCDSCKLCDRHCPGNLRISNVKYVSSIDCTYCHKCCDVCPTKAVTLQNCLTGRQVTNYQYSLGLLAVLAAGIVAAKLTGHWDSAVLPVLWAKYLPYISEIFHP
jgi:polyferredoxin